MAGDGERWRGETWRSQQNKKVSANQQLALAHPPKTNDCATKVSKAIGSPGLSKQLTTASLLASGFQDKGANWKDRQLYYFSESSGIRYHGFRRLNTFSTLSDKSQQNHHLRTNDFLFLSERVVERDDGMFELWPHGEGPFPTRAFAEAVRAHLNRHDSKWRAA
jgi:hypothetical protein